jgi:hypothetical protein
MIQPRDAQEASRPSEAPVATAFLGSENRTHLIGGVVKPRRQPPLPPNQGENADYYDSSPAARSNYSDVVSVGDVNHLRSKFSNFDTCITVYAPGGERSRASGPVVQTTPTMPSQERRWCAHMLWD